MRSASLAKLAREYIWLWDIRHGTSIQEIAQREGVSLRRVRLGVSRARCTENPDTGDTAGEIRLARPPRLVPLFPIASYVPTSVCPHHAPLPNGTMLCCMICHECGVEGHPALQRSHLTDPAPEPKAPRARPADKPEKETRKERRKRLFSKAANPL